MRTRSDNRGFTLVEILVVIIVVGVLGAIALPAMSRWVPNQRLKGAARDITSVLAQAKAEAIRRGERVTVLFNYQHPDLANGQKQLYVMFMDTGVDDGKGGKTGWRDAQWQNGRNGQTGEEIILQSGPMPGQIALDGSNTTCVSNGVGFNTRAMPVISTSKKDDSMGACTIRLCVGDSEDRLGKPCRNVKIASAGRVRTELINK